MLLWARRVFDVKAGEGLPVALTFVYIALVVCAFLLAKPIRNALFLKQYGPYALVYVYAAVPAVLAVFVPIYSRIAARFGSRVVAIATLLFFSTNVLAFLVRLPISSVLAAAGHPVCLGQLLRHYRACPGVEPDKCVVRHAPGQTAVWPDRLGRLARRDRGRACWRGFSWIPSAARSTCCSFWPSSS